LAKEEKRTRSKRPVIVGIIALIILVGAVYYYQSQQAMVPSPAPTPAPPPKKVTISIATGGTGGVYYPLGGAMASLWTRTVPNLEASAEVTTASVDNMKLIRDGKADVALTLPDTAFDAYSGKAAFDRPVPVRALMILYTNYYHIVTSEGKGINTVTDLKGKRVSLGAPGSGTEVIGVRILEAYGLDPAKDILRERLGVKESADALKDGKIDAFFWSGGLPTAAVLDYASSPGAKVKLIPQGDAVPKMVQKYGPIYFVDTIPKGTYPGQTTDVEVVGATNLLVANEKMPKDLAYKLVKAFFDNQKDILTAHAVVKDIKLEKQQAKFSSVPFHEGAIQFYTEKGVWK